jgi:hypothetical protein
MLAFCSNIQCSQLRAVGMQASLPQVRERLSFTLTKQGGIELLVVQWVATEETNI